MKLGAALVLDQDEVEVESSREYKIAGVLGFGRGLFARGPMTGAETAYRKMHRLHTDHLVVSRLKAFEGALAVVPQEFDGWFVSPEFPTFRCVDGALDPRYLVHLCRWPELWSILAGTSKGIGARRERVHAAAVLNLELQLPPVSAQLDAALHLDTIATNLEHMRATRTRAATLMGSLTPAVLENHFSTAGAGRPLVSAAKIRRGCGPRYADGSGVVAINQACIKWSGIDVSNAREVEVSWHEACSEESRVRAGDVLVNSTGEGTIGRAATATKEVDGLPFDSHILAVRCAQGQLEPRYLAAYLRSPSGQAQIEATKGANTTKQTELGKAKLERLVVPVPLIEEQRQFLARLDRFLGRLHELNVRATQRERLLKALFPAALNEAFAGLS